MLSENGKYSTLRNLTILLNNPPPRLMKPPLLSIPYGEVLLTNCVMLAILGILYGSGRLFDSLGLLLVFVLVVVLVAILELALYLRALFTGQLSVALVYGILFVLVAKLDWWLLEQAQ